MNFNIIIVFKSILKSPIVNPSLTKGILISLAIYNLQYVIQLKFKNCSFWKILSTITIGTYNRNIPLVGVVYLNIEINSVNIQGLKSISCKLIFR